MYHPTPSQARLATQLTEEEQIRIAQRIGLIQHLPKGVYDGGKDDSEKKIREWAAAFSLLYSASLIVWNNGWLMWHFKSVVTGSVIVTAAIAK